jgi:hypothetical protein
MAAVWGGARIAPCDQWAAAIAYTVIFAAVGVAGPNVVMYDKNSPYAFTAAQMGHHDVQAPAGDAGKPESADGLLLCGVFSQAPRSVAATGQSGRKTLPGGCGT